LDMFVSELAVVLARLPNIETWSSDDVQMVSRLFVRNMVSNAEEVVEMPDGRPDLEERIKEGARRQMRLIVIGFANWKS
ncbi:MAG: TetR family transcriptional regulator, partial [Aeromicrobium sp.]